MHPPHIPILDSSKPIQNATSPLNSDVGNTWGASQKVSYYHKNSYYCHVVNHFLFQNPKVFISISKIQKILSHNHHIGWS